MRLHRDRYSTCADDLTARVYSNAYTTSSQCRQFQLIDDRLDLAQEGDGDAAASVPALLHEALDANARLEAAVRQCLGLSV